MIESVDVAVVVERITGLASTALKSELLNAQAGLGLLPFRPVARVFRGEILVSGSEMMHIRVV